MFTATQVPGTFKYISRENRDKVYDEGIQKKVIWTSSGCLISTRDLGELLSLLKTFDLDWEFG